MVVAAPESRRGSGRQPSEVTLSEQVRHGESDSGMGSPGEETGSRALSPRPPPGDAVYSPRPVGVVPHGGPSTLQVEAPGKAKAFSGKSTLSTR